MRSTMKRVLALMVLAAILATMMASAAMASGTKTFVTTGKCYMRVAPDKNSKKVQTIKSGKTFKATDCEVDSRGVKWYFGSYNGQVGWVSSKNLKTKSSDPTPAPTKKPSKDPSYKAYVQITGSCNIRKNHDLSAQKIGSANKGDFFKCSGAKYDDRGVAWYKINYYGKTAWVSSKYAKPVKSAPSTATVAPKATPKPIDYSAFEAAEYYVRVTSSTLNMRYEPNTSSSIVASYNNGDILYAMRTNGEWFQVLDEETNRSGYMSAKYLEAYIYEDEAEEADPETEVVTSGVVANIEELQAATPRATLIDAPEGSTDVVYSWHYIGANDVTAAEITFKYEGIEYTLRAAYSPTAEEAVDIDDVDTVPEHELEEQHIEMAIDGSAAVAHYYDKANMTQYSLTGPAAENGKLVEEMATRLFTVEETNTADITDVEEAA